jgi:hypothetical protein
MKHILLATTLGLVSLNILAVESDEHVGTCFVYMMQNQYGNGARIVAKKTTDLEAAHHYVMSALRSKVSVADGVAACTKLNIDMRNYKPVPIVTITTQKE